MAVNTIVGRISGAALVSVLGFALGSTAAQSQDRDYRRDDHREMRRDYGHERDGRDRYYGHDRDGRDRDSGRNYDRDRGRDFHFDDRYRQHFESHYRRDADHWRGRRDRVHFMRGDRIPVGYRVQPVPVTYYREVPPPPGYQYGYYEGYVVAYDPTTRMIGDVLDLVGAAMNR